MQSHNPEEKALQQVASLGPHSMNRIDEILATQIDIIKRNHKGDFIPIPGLENRNDILNNKDLELAKQLHEEIEQIKFKQHQVTAYLLEIVAKTPNTQWEKVRKGLPGSYADMHSFEYVAQLNNISLSVTYSDGEPNAIVSYKKGYRAHISFISEPKKETRLKRLFGTKIKKPINMTFNYGVSISCNQNGDLVKGEHTFSNDEQANKFLEILKELFENLNEIEN